MRYQPDRGPALTYSRIFWFWIPLAANWLMMAVEQPVLTGFIARMAEPEKNLASYGIVISVAVVLQSPIYMLMTTGTALSRSGRSYKRLLSFSHLLVGILTALHLLIALTPLYGLLFSGLVGAPEEVVALSRIAFLLVTPWAAAIGYRQLWQGVLIRFRRTWVVLSIIAVRLVVSVIAITIGFVLRLASGVYVALAAYSAGVITSAVYAYIITRIIVGRNFRSVWRVPEQLSWRGLVSFYMPLAATSLIFEAARPIMSVALARLPLPLVSLAVWPVLYSVLFLGRSIAISFQEAVIALLRDERSMNMLRRFGSILTVILLALFVVFAATPLGRVWFERVAGLSPEMAKTAARIFALLAPLPAISALIFCERAFLVTARHTSAITRSVVLELGILVLFLFVFGSLLSSSGAFIAAASYTVSVTTEWGYLRYAGAKAREELRTRFAG